MSRTAVLYQDHLILELPDEFAELNADSAQKYFTGGSPDIVYAWDEKKALVTVSRAEMRLESSDIEKRLNEYHHVYSRSTANFGNVRMAKKQLDQGGEIGAFQYTSTTVERDLLNLFVLLSVEGKETAITMHCSAQDALTAGKSFMKILNSIRVK